MNKSQLHAATSHAISSTSIVRTDGEPGTYKIVGKFAEIEPMDDGTFDLWITDTSSPAATLSSRKVANIVSAVQNAVNPALIRYYDGEASLALEGLEALSNADLWRTLGVRRKRKVSEATRQASAARLKALRDAA